MTVPGDKRQMIKGKRVTLPLLSVYPVSRFIGRVNIRGNDLYLTQYAAFVQFSISSLSDKHSLPILPFKGTIASYVFSFSAYTKKNGDLFRSPFFRSRLIVFLITGVLSIDTT